MKSDFEIISDNYIKGCVHCSHKIFVAVFVTISISVFVIMNKCSALLVVSSTSSTSTDIVKLLALSRELQEIARKRTTSAATTETRPSVTAVEEIQTNTEEKTATSATPPVTPLLATHESSAFVTVRTSSSKFSGLSDRENPTKKARIEARPPSPRAETVDRPTQRSQADDKYINGDQHPATSGAYYNQHQRMGAISKQTSASHSGVFDLRNENRNEVNEETNQQHQPNAVDLSGPVRIEEEEEEEIDYIQLSNNTNKSFDTATANDDQQEMAFHGSSFDYIQLSNNINKSFHTATANDDQHGMAFYGYLLKAIQHFYFDYKFIKAVIQHFKNVKKDYMQAQIKNCHPDLVEGFKDLLEDILCDFRGKFTLP